MHFLYKWPLITGYLHNAATASEFLATSQIFDFQFPATIYRLFVGQFNKIVSFNNRHCGEKMLSSGVIFALVVVILGHGQWISRNKSIFDLQLPVTRHRLYICRLIIILSAAATGVNIRQIVKRPRPIIINFWTSFYRPLYIGQQVTFKCWRNYKYFFSYFWTKWCRLYVDQYNTMFIVNRSNHGKTFLRFLQTILNFNYRPLWTAIGRLYE